MSTDRSAIVTGAGYGIGRATARLLARDGWATVLVDRAPDRLEAVRAAIVAAGGRADVVTGDVRDAATAAAAVEAGQALAPLKGLVPCAAFRHPGRITDITEAQWDETVGVVLKAVFLFCKAAIPVMAANGGGSIVTVSSTDAEGRRGMVAYAAAKAAIETLSLSLAADHEADRIRVNTVVPGFTLTGMTEGQSPERLAERAARSVAGRLATAEDVAAMIRFLMSEAGETFTGGIFGARTLPAR
jgi:meso-butanediol dehydrogenase/(S,S)-butanediol dehydrogenase/diacetyl reductase